MIEVGDLICHESPSGPHLFWRVEGVYLGGEGQESLVELRSVSQKPGVVGGSAETATALVPEPLLRAAPLYRRVGPAA